MPRNAVASRRGLPGGIAKMADEHRSSADAVVVGGGVMGCSILYNLGAMGMTDAVLVEQAGLASGSTGRRKPSCGCTTRTR